MAYHPTDVDEPIPVVETPISIRQPDDAWSDDEWDGKQMNKFSKGLIKNLGEAADHAEGSDRIGSKGWRAIRPTLKKLLGG
jgi:hypothetical protein